MYLKLIAKDIIEEGEGSSKPKYNTPQQQSALDSPWKREYIVIIPADWTGVGQLNNTFNYFKHSEDLTVHNSKHIQDKPLSQSLVTKQDFHFLKPTNE